MTDSGLTLEKLREAVGRLAELTPKGGFGIPVHITVDAVKKGDRLFPESKHRSKRVKKKLIKRFGGEFERLPAVLTTGQALYIHPALKHLLDDIDRAPAVLPSQNPILRGSGVAWRYLASPILRDPSARIFADIDA